MNQIKFAHLHAHSTYSFLDGYGTPEQIAKRVVELGQTACAQTDHGNCFGHVPWQRAAQAADIKPIFGCEFYIVADATERTRYDESLGVEALPHITVLARTNEGYQNFLKLMELSYAQYYYKPRISLADLLRHQSGLFILTGCPTGFPTRYINSGKIDLAHRFIADINKGCERSAVEMVMQPGYAPSEYACRILADIAADLNMPVVATADAHFPRAEDHEVEDLMLHIKMKVPVGKPKAIGLPAYQFYCSGEELLQRGIDMFAAGNKAHGFTIPSSSQITQWIEQSSAIAEECSVTIRPVSRVQVQVPVGFTAEDILRRKVAEGFVERGVSANKLQTYQERANREIALLTEKGFCDYILVVEDITSWSKRQGYVTLCRGSAGGSLVLWAIGASETDSIAHDLSFERFYDYTRPDPPDVDIDFESSVRESVIQYISTKYGADRVAQIMALSMLRPRVAIADVAQAYCIPRAEYEHLTSALDSKNDDLDAQLDAVGELSDPLAEELLQKYPRLRIASRLMGQIRQSTIHAAGVVISGEALNHSVAVVQQPGKPAVATIDKNSAGYLGLLKFDLLSVSAYDIIGNAVRRAGLSMQTLHDLPMDDPGVYAMLRTGKVVGIFQLDGTAMTIGHEIGLDSFEDLYACSALCRPGARQFAPLYARNKKNKTAFDAHMAKFSEVAQRIISPTYGVVLYQEQMMALAREVAGMEWPEVHKLRKRVSNATAFGAELGEDYKRPFVDGCIANNISEAEAEYWWSAIKQHGVYSFNKAHCVTYGIVGYWMAWLKLYHPTEYFWAFMQQEGLHGNNHNLMKRIVREWQETGGKLQLVSISKPTSQFEIIDTNTICGGWNNLSGVGEKIAKTITSKGPYKSWSQLGSVAPRSVYSSLVEAGVAGTMTENPAILLRLASWFPVTATDPKISGVLEPKRKSLGIYTPKQLLDVDESLQRIRASGYLSSRYKKPRAGVFTGDKIIYTLEDETGVITVRVASKRSALLQDFDAKTEIGDYLIVDGWWDGKGTLYVSDFKTLRKWNA